MISSNGVVEYALLNKGVWMFRVLRLNRVISFVWVFSVTTSAVLSSSLAGDGKYSIVLGTYGAKDAKWDGCADAKKQREGSYIVIEPKRLFVHESWCDILSSHRISDGNYDVVQSCRKGAQKFTERLNFVGGTLTYRGKSYRNCASSEKKDERDYTLVCAKEAQWGRSGNPLTKPLNPPLIARVKFTGSESRFRDPHPEANGQITPYEDLTVEILGRTMRGGAVKGSTYDTSTVYDDRFKATGISSTGWAFSRGLSAWNLKHDGKDYICKMQ